MASELQVTTLRGVPTGANANQILVPSGQTLVAPGHIIQMQVGTHTSSSSTSTSGTSLVDTPLEVIITPKVSTSKILIICTFAGASHGGGSNQSVHGAIKKNGSVLWQTHRTSYEDAFLGINNGAAIGGTHTFQVYDNSPSSSANTYKLAITEYNSDNVVYYYGDTENTITAMEIAQ